MPVPSLLQMPAQIGSGLLAEPVSGWAGLYGLLRGDSDGGAARVAAMRKKLTYTATDPRAQRVLSDMGQTMQPLAQGMNAIHAPFNDIASPLADSGHPGMATAVGMVPDVAMNFLGGRGAAAAQPEMAAAGRQMMERSAGPAMGGPHAQYGSIGAWHGSPHDFDQFSMDKLGTGEGAQAYGHGLYFAGDKGVAQQYQKALGGHRLSYPDGDSYNVRPAAYSPEDFALRAMSDNAGDYAKARATFHNEIDGARKVGDGDTIRHREAALSALNDWEAMGAQVTPDGKLYNVELAPDEHDLLDWNAPLSQQPEKVRAAILSNLPDASQFKGPLKRKLEAIAQGDHSITGDSLYSAFGGHSSPQGASDALRNLGIPGIRYLDGGSRAAGDGSRNYVMFNDQDVKIKGKE